MKRCSTSLIIREMQIKTKMSYLITPIRRFIIKKSTNNKCWWGWGQKGTILPCCWKSKLVQSLWKTVWRVLKKLKIEPPYDPAILYLDTYLKKTKTLIWKDTCNPIFIAASFTVLEIWKQPECPSKDEWINKFSHSDMSDSSWLHGLQHARLRG